MSTKKGTWLFVNRTRALYLPLICAALFMLIMIVHYSVNTPFWDSWEMVPLFEAAGHHTLSLADLWRQHNEHRIFFPNIVLLVAAYLTHWSTRIEVIIGFMFSLISASLIFLMIKKSVSKWWLGLIAGTLTAVWFFSPVQWENWLWGWQVEWFMCIAGIVTATFLLLKYTDSTAKHRLIYLILSAIVAIVASFSLAGGLFVWLVGVVILFVTKQNRRVQLGWIVLAILSAALYYYHYTSPPGPNGATGTFFLHHPLAFFEFFLAYIGGPIGSVSGQLQAPVIIGSILLLILLPLLYLVWQNRTNLRKYLPWLMFCLIGILGALTTGVGRLSYGVGFALSSRYTAFSGLYVIGLTLLAICLFDDLSKTSKNFRQVAIGGLLLASLPLIISSYAVGFHGFRNQSALLKEIKSCTHAPDPSNACLSLTYPNPSIVRPRLEYIKAKHWAGY